MRNIESTIYSHAMIKEIISKCVKIFKNLDIEGSQIEQYWSDKQSQYQFIFQGVENAALTYKNNEQMYLGTKEIFISVCNEMAIDFTKTRILEIGCGTGFYARIFKENGCENYIGVDITDVLFDQLEEDLHGFKFHKLDISSEILNHRFDLIVMIDVTQHITNHEKFSFAMQNIRRSLTENGTFIVTSWLNENAHQGFYEVSRSLKTYQAEFPDCIFSQPIPFKDKFIFAIQNKK